MRVPAKLNPGEFVLAVLSGPLEEGGSDYHIPNTATTVQDGYVMLTFRIPEKTEPGPYQISQVQVRRGLGLVRNEPLSQYLHIYVTIVADPLLEPRAYY
jgi:hypothetical protein